MPKRTSRLPCPESTLCVVWYKERLNGMQRERLSGKIDGHWQERVVTQAAADHRWQIKYLEVAV